ncbi:MAG: SH3 domain-containing protein, partial [Deltaproteobacteria bacterium]|nr:SH3 domain-containing protein [Deltaproteobacteria bacterium]
KLKKIKFGLLLFGVVALLVVVAAGISRATPSAGLQAVVRVAKVNVRKAPDKNSRRLFSLRRKSMVKVLKERDQWLYIATDTGRRGWLFKSLVRIVKPRKVNPKIEFFSNGLESEQELFFVSLISRLGSQLAAVEVRYFDFVVSRLDADAVSGSDPGIGKEAVPWLLVLRVPFSRDLYQQEKGNDLEVGTIDLLLYQGYLKVMLESRDLMIAEIKKNPQLWNAAGAGSGAVKVLIVLKSENGDQVVLSGFRERGFPVFNDYIILEIHGFSQFSLHSTMSANVADFNQFVLPPSQLPDGSRAPAALAYDFFGFSY